MPFLEPGVSSGWWIALVWWPGLQAPALHERIDQAISSATPLASDAEFVRRVYLDLAGIIPPAAEVRAFLSDPSARKREQLIDRLLASPDYARNMQEVWDALLMERRPDKHVPRAAWQDYLRQSFADNKPWDQLVRELLSADGSDPARRPAAKFYLDREGEPHLLTRDISRLFLAMNLQCAQCHDHPNVRAYKQEQYYGLFAFLNRGVLFTDKAKLTVFAEKAEGEATYLNVFDPTKEVKSARPHVPFGSELVEPVLEKGKDYKVAPAPGVRPEPSFSRRVHLATCLASADCVPFKRNIANRLWALMMGRGLVQPLDMDQPANPPSHPELLSLLAEELAAGHFNVRWFLRELALSRTYQRSSRTPAGGRQADPASFTVAILKPLSPEQLAWSVMRATGLIDAERRAGGMSLTEEKLHAKLMGNLPPFVAAFGSQPGQSEHGFEATVDQALFLTNGALVSGWLVPRAGNLTDRLGHLAQPDAVAEELFLSVLSRLPSDQEQKDVADFLTRRTQDRAKALQELVGILLTGVEFRFNH